MMRKRGLVVIGVLSLFFAAASPASVAIAASGDPDHSKSKVSVYATGLDAPRGLAFGPHGVLYVAEAGTGGTTTSVDACPELQVPAPLGPVMNGPTARISKISRSGVRSTVVDGLPSSVTQLGGDEVGVADVAIVDGRLYAIIAGGGCSNGLLTRRFRTE